MRLKFAIASTFLALLCITTPAAAENPTHVRPGLFHSKMSDDVQAAFLP